MLIAFFRAEKDQLSYHEASAELLHVRDASKNKQPEHSVIIGVEISGLKIKPLDNCLQYYFLGEYGSASCNC